MLAWHKD